MPFFVSTTESGRYKFFSLLLPLYIRLKKEEIKNQETRGKILGFVAAKPGAYYSEIKKELGLKNGTFDYHIGVLLRENKIKKREEGFKVRFFPYLFNIGDINQYKDITEKEKKYLFYIREHEIATVKEIAKFFKTKNQNVYPTIKNLKEKNLIFYKDEGRISKQSITLTDKGREKIDEFMKKNKIKIPYR